MKTLVLALLTGVLALGCDEDDDGFELGDADDPWDVEVEPDDFVAQIDNPLLPLRPGARWVYEAETEDGELEVITVEVTGETREIWDGVTATIVRDTVTVDGELVEDTFDWFAQDEDGNVWYFGEDTCELEDGECVDTAGSWEAGVDGALPGVVMLATPRVGDQYYQEFYRGVAEDFGEVVEVGVSVGLEIGSFDGCVRTRDTTALEPDVEEFKTYCPGVGTVLEEEEDTTVELVEFGGL